MKSAPAPVEQHEQPGQRASRADRDVEESGLRQRLQEPWTFAGYRAQFGIESTAFPGRRARAAQQRAALRGRLFLVQRAG
jgi:hypothetical protein